MKERPILFSTPMVQAILSGAKTQTRRIVTKHRSGPCDTSRKKDLDWNQSLIYPNNPFGIKLMSKVDTTVHRVRPPYQPGDHLWVRETFGKLYELYVYRADYLPGGTPPASDWKWTPSIFMPRAASRILLEITKVHVERLHDITEEDAMAEGITLPNYANQAIEDVKYPAPSELFMDLWQSINGPGSVKSNPWVWVINFKVIST